GDPWREFALVGLLIGRDPALELQLGFVRGADNAVLGSGEVALFAEIDPLDAVGGVATRDEDHNDAGCDLFARHYARRRILRRRARDQQASAAARIGRRRRLAL